MNTVPYAVCYKFAISIHVIVHSLIISGLVRHRLNIAKHCLEVARQLAELFVEAEEVLGKLSEMEVPRTEFLLQREVGRNHFIQFLPKVMTRVRLAAAGCRCC